MSVNYGNLSTSEMYIIGKQKYANTQTGMEMWKSDLMRFVSEEFHNMLNSSDSNVSQSAIQELVLWASTTGLSLFFQGTWGSDQNNKSLAMQYLNTAQMLEQKFNDQMIIEIIDLAILDCCGHVFEFND